MGPWPSHCGQCGDPLIRLLLAGLLLFMLLHLTACGTPPRAKGSSHGGKISPSATWYRVKKGDSLYAVSWRAGMDWKTLARWNGLKPPYTIYPGQLLRLKPPPRRPRSTARRPAAPRHGAAASTTTARAKEKSGKAASARPPAAPGKRPAARGGSLQWQWPTKGRIVSRFSHSDPDLDGIKIAGVRGQKVVAAEAGTVVYTGSGLIGYGQLIIVKHNNEFLSAYGLNRRLYVKEGQRVKRGQHISDMGSDSAGRPMLHFEIRRYGKPVDPLAYLPRG